MGGEAVLRLWARGCCGETLLRVRARPGCGLILVVPFVHVGLIAATPPESAIATLRLRRGRGSCRDSRLRVRPAGPGTPDDSGGWRTDNIFMGMMWSAATPSWP